MTKEARLDVADIRALAAKLREYSIPPVMLNAHKVHPTCCKGWRVQAKHSPYCFAQREYYVGVMHPLSRTGGRTGE